MVLANDIGHNEKDRKRERMQRKNKGQVNKQTKGLSHRDEEIRGNEKRPLNLNMKIQLSNRLLTHLDVKHMTFMMFMDVEDVDMVASF